MAKKNSTTVKVEMKIHFQEMIKELRHAVGNLINYGQSLLLGK
jgi:hypothetical protein